MNIKEKDGQSRKRIIRGFLINGGILPGSSGSPIILKPTHYRHLGNQISYDNFPPLLLGIASETRFIFTDKFYDIEYYSLANLGIVLDAVTIKETVDMFDKNNSLIL